MSTVALRKNVQAQVLYEYEGKDDDQLTIKPGDVIIILDNSQDLNGWALAQKGDKEGYVPAEYVRYIDPNPSSDENGSSNSGGYETFYDKYLIQDHSLPFKFKLTKAFRDVFVPFPCSRFGYVTSRTEFRTGMIFSFIVNFVICTFDIFSIIVPALCIGNPHKTPNSAQIALVFLNIICRIIFTLIFIYRYPRPNLIICSFPILNVISSITYGIRLYECLEIGDNKEYDGYRFYRTWMYCFLINIVFEIVSLIFGILKMPGLLAIFILVLVWNLVHAGRCFLIQWANIEKGNDLHPDFEATIKKYKL